MNIIQINETCGVGSTGRTTQELAYFLQQNGHQAYVFYAARNCDYPRRFLIGSPLDHRVHALLSRITGLQGYFSRRATRQMLKTLAALQPDVVHLRGLHGNYIHLGLLLKYLAQKDVPTVLTLHDCWLFTGKCTHYVSAGCERWQTCCHHCPLLHVDNINPTWFFDRTKKCFLDKKRWLQAIPRLAVVGVSQWMCREAGSSFFKDRNPICIYNWIDRDVFYPRDPAPACEKYGLQNAFVVLMVTSLVSPVKGYEEFMGLARQMKGDCRFVLVGRNAQNLPIPQNVLFLPFTESADELAQLYSAADVCVNVTRFETFGKVTAEALCCGTPVVVYNNTASPELVGEKCGYVVEEADGLEGVKRAVERIKSDGKAAYSGHCVRFAAERFDKEAGFRQYRELYERLAKQA